MEPKATVLCEGVAFAITEHSLYEGCDFGGTDNRFKVISLTHEVANNLGAETTKILQTSDLDEGGYRNHFQAVPGAFAGRSTPGHRSPTRK